MELFLCFGSLFSFSLGSLFYCTANALAAGLGSLFCLLGFTLGSIGVDLLNLALFQTFLDSLANGSQDDVD